MRLELDDIQSGALYPRPSPYVGTYLLLRIDDRTAGRELVRRLHRVVDSGRPSSDPARDAWVTVAFTYRGLEALGVPQDSLDSFAPEFREGMAARASELGDVGDSSPGNWEKPLGTSDVHVALAALSPDSPRLEGAVGKIDRALGGLPGVELIWRQDCYQLPTGRAARRERSGARRWSDAGRAARRSCFPRSVTIPSSAPTRAATTTSFTATTSAASSVRSARMPAVRIQGTRSTTRAVSTSASTA